MGQAKDTMKYYSVTLIWSDDEFRSYKIKSINPQDALHRALTLAVEADGELAASGLASWLVLDTYEMQVTKGNYSDAPIDAVCNAWNLTH